MVTGQYVRTHGVVANGVALPADAPSVAAHLHAHGYRTALVGKAHFEPAMDLRGKWPENRLGRQGSYGPHRGFEHMELAMHVPLGGWHYSVWLQREHPEATSGFAPLLSAAGGGETGAPEVAYNPIAREWYHTDWDADWTIAWLDSCPPLPTGSAG
jgi:arylsulfatase A-like enzyme